MALNFLLSSSMNIGGRWIGAPEQAGFCTFNGFMTQVFVIQTDYWIFVIAVYTYFVLTDQKRCCNWIQTHPLVPWVLPWILSVAWASIGLVITGYGDIGAWCWFTSDQVRLLVNFVPRCRFQTILPTPKPPSTLTKILPRDHHRHHVPNVREAVLLPLPRPSPPGLPGRFFVHKSHRVRGSPTRRQRFRRACGASEAYPKAEESKSGLPTHSSLRTSSFLLTSDNQLARLMLLYPLAYAVIWSLPTGIRIYQSASGRPAPWQLQTVDKACIVLQGLVDAVIYGATESSLSSWRNLFFPTRFPPVVADMPPAFGCGDPNGTGGPSNK